uniref:MADF domain-containing protein n=1 Tax=Steinernema glaseri TaxID=37863 RepID=A0A1I8A4K3_9BILA
MEIALPKSRALGPKVSRRLVPSFYTDVLAGPTTSSSPRRALEQSIIAVVLGPRSCGSARAACSAVIATTSDLAVPRLSLSGLRTIVNLESLQMATRKSARIADTQQRHAAEVAKHRESTAFSATSPSSSAHLQRSSNVSGHHHQAQQQQQQQQHRTPVQSSAAPHNAHLATRSAPAMSSALPGTQARNPSLQDVYGDQSIIDLIDLIKENSVLWTYEIGLGSRSASRPLCMAWNIVYEAMVEKYPQVTRNMLKQAWKSLKRRHRQTGGTFSFSRRMAFLDGAELDLNSSSRSFSGLSSAPRSSTSKTMLRFSAVRSAAEPPRPSSNPAAGYQQVKRDPAESLNSMYPDVVQNMNDDEMDEQEDPEDNVMVGGDDTPRGAASRVTSTVNVCGDDTSANIDVQSGIDQLQATIQQFREHKIAQMSQASDVAALNEVLQNNKAQAFPLGELIKDRLEQLDDKSKLWEAERRILSKVEEIVADVLQQQEAQQARQEAAVAPED